MKIIFCYYYYTEKIKDKNRIEFPPLGMLYICSVFESLGHDVRVIYIDNNSNYESFPDADIYAYSISSTVAYPVFKKLVPDLKSKAKIHIAGNTHASIFPEMVLKELELDVVFCGESELAIKSWLINGCKERGVIIGNRTPNIDFPFPARHLLPDDKIYMQGRVGGNSKYSISMISSRGCIYQCQFCGIQNRGYVSYRSLENFEQEVQFLLLSYPKCDGVTLLDETFTFNDSFAVNISNIFKKYSLPWECNSRIDTLSTDVIRSLSISNCEEIRIGIESGSQKLLDYMKKGINLSKAVEVLKLLKEYNLKIKLYIMHGYPGEDIETTKETIDFLHNNDSLYDRISLYQFAPLPGSPVFEELFSMKHYDWSAFSIYDNNIHWWGDTKDFVQKQKAFIFLKEHVDMINNGKVQKAGE